MTPTLINAEKDLYIHLQTNIEETKFYSLGIISYNKIFIISIINKPPKRLLVIRKQPK